MDWSNEELEEYQHLYRADGGRGLSLEESRLSATQVYKAFYEDLAPSNNEYEINGISNTRTL